MSLSAAERGAMDRAVAEVRRAFLLARAKVAAVTASNQAVDVLAALGQAFAGLLSREGDYSAEAIRKQVADQNERAEAWAFAERAQVELGSITLEWWLAAGRTYAAFAASAAQTALDASVFATAASTAKETAADTARGAARLADPRLWPAWLPWAAGGVALVVVLAVAAPYARALGVAK